MRFLLLPLFLLGLASCGSDANTDPDATTEAEPIPLTAAYQPAAAALAKGEPAARVATLLMDNFTAVSDAQTGALNEKASQDFVDLAGQLAERYPTDTAAALPYYRSAEVVRALNDPKRAADIYGKVHDRYPTFSKAAESLFMLAFTYDEDLQQLDQARAAYENFLQRYPNHPFADDSQMLLRNLGKTDEEILRELEEQAGQ